MAVTDFILNKDVIDFGFSDDNHIEDLLILEKGWHRFKPLIGVGIKQYLNADKTFNTKRKLERAIRLNVNGDGAEIHSLKTNENIEDIYIDAEYNS